VAAAEPAAPTVGDVVAALERRYPPAWAQDWDRVGLVLGEPAGAVRRVLCVVDCVPETVAEALAEGADLIVAHHPLLLRGVSSVAPTTYKGRIVHDLIRNDVALYVAHTNADVANPGVSDALSTRLDLRSTRPLSATADDPSLGLGRIGQLPALRRVRRLAAGGRGGRGRGRLPHRGPPPPPGQRAPRRRRPGAAGRGTLGDRATLAGRAGRLARRHPRAGGGGLRPRHRPVDPARPRIRSLP
jgi:putative NIF3 family GTP cyclohydrolase 1 type 2